MKHRFGVAMAATIVLALTLPPGRPFEGAPRLLGDRWLSDAILNVLLFVPLGAALGTGLLPTRRLVLGAMVFSAGIESAQLFIPGRDASVPDVACNTMGAALGIALWRGRRRYLSPAKEHAGWLAIGSAGAATAVMAATGLLLQPSLPRSTYFGQWTPNLGHLEWYRGRVLDARLGGIPVHDGRMECETGERVRALLLARAPLEVRAIAGPPTSRLGSLVSVYDGQQREIVLLGPRGSDLLLRLRTRSVTLGLEDPPLRWRGALSGVGAGDTLVVGVWARGNGECLGVNGREACGVAHTIGEGWALLASGSLAGIPERVLEVAWLAVLVLPVGLWLRWGASGVTAVVVSGGGAFLGARLLGASSPSWWEIAALLAGLVGGAALRPLAQRAAGEPSAAASASTHRSMRA